MLWETRVFIQFIFGMWKYVAEGNASVVVRCTADPSLSSGNDDDTGLCRLDDDDDGDAPPLRASELEGWVLRISKRPVDVAAVEQYRCRLVAPLLGEQYFSPAVRVRVRVRERGAEGEWMAALQRAIDATATARPVKRKQRQREQGQALCADTMLLMHNAALLPSPQPPRLLGLQQHVVAVEIKPKTGFLAVSPFIAQANAVKHEFCRFCMHRQLRVLRQGEAGRNTRYCPIDLFSGEPLRVQHALRCLVDEPSNNLRLFIDGDVVYTSDHERNSCNEAIAALLGPAEPANNRLHTFCALVAKVLVREPLLPRLRDHQATLDKFDVEFVGRVYEHLVAEGVDVGHALREYELAMSSIVHPIVPVPVHAIEHLSRNDQLGIVRNFLVAATLKDCSIFVTMTAAAAAAAADGATHVVRTSSGSAFEYKLTVIDVDRKDVHKIPKYLEQDQEIVSAFDLSLHSRGPCSDAGDPKLRMSQN